MNNIKVLFKNNTPLYIIFSYIFYIFIFYEYFRYGQFLQDDWSIAENGYLNDSFLKNLNTYLSGFITRPVGALILSILSNFKYDFTKYLIVNISIHFIFATLIFKIFSHKYNKSIALILSSLLIFPNLSSTNIFSPAAQSLGTFSLFFWSISFYLLYFSKVQKNKTKELISWLFFIISVLTYEISFILILFNLFLFKNNILNIFANLIKLKIKNIFFQKEVVVFLVIFFLIFIYQLFFVKFIPFTESNRYRILETDTLNLIFQYYHIPLTLILKTISFFTNGFFVFSEKITYNLLIFFLLFLLLIRLNLNDLKIKKFEVKSISLLVFFSYILFLIFFIIAASLPEIKGYYNRAMGAYNFLFVLTILMLILSLPINLRLKKIFLIIIVLINFNLFVNQIEKNINSSKIRNKIVKNISNEIVLNNINKGYVFSLIPTLPSNDFINQIIFSEESYDFNKALLFTSGRKLSGIRIYKPIECSEKKFFKIQDDKMIFYNPSRSRKSKNLFKTEMKINLLHNYYFYNYKSNSLFELDFSRHPDILFKRFIDC